MATRISQRTRGIALAVIAILVFVILAGVTYQSVATALERRQFPHPGRLVDVGGHQLHLYCIGEGRPAVVLEAAAAGMSTGWGWVQDDLKKTTRVCSYDRAGLGWSESGDGDYDPQRVSQELHTLLERAGEHGPFVIAGHELGATYARLFAARFRQDTAALVLIDDPAATDAPPRPVISRLVPAWPWLARVGVLRFTGSLSRYATGLPDSSSGATRAFLNRPDHLTRGAIEVAHVRALEAMAAANPIDPALRVVHVTTSRQEPPAVLSSTDRARTVARAIAEVVAHARKK